MRLNEPAEKARPRKKLTTKPNQTSSAFLGDSSPARRYHHRQHRQHIECSIRNLVGLVLLTATIMCSGFVRAKTIYDSVNRIPDLPPDAVTSKAPMRTTASVGSFGSTATPTHTLTPNLFSTQRNSYDSNQIDNSFPADGTSQAIEEDSDSDSDSESDADVDDYVIDESSTVAAAILEQGNPLKSQDLESLSLQSAAAESVASKTSPEDSLRKNSFQQLGSQKVNALVPATVATVHSDAAAHASSISAAAPTEPARNRSGSVVRNSAVKVDGKHPLSKGQKTDAPMLNYIFDTFSSANKHHHHDQRYGPHFEDVQRVGQTTNLTVQAGSSIHLNCRISLLQDKTVSWVRHNTVEEDNALDLLTVGMHTYTGDKRYKMEFQYPNNWRLKITNVKKDDEAMYECQISTHPPRVIQINLHVNAPKVMIVDEVGDPLQEKYYEIDSTLQLSCVVRNVAMTSSVVLWKHADDILNYDVTRGGVSVKTELMEDGANSTLSIAKISKTDSGNYTCSISEFQNFTIVVHILNGESFAELHHGGAGLVRTMRWQLVALQLLALLLLTTASRLRGKFS